MIPEWAGRYVSLPYNECNCWQLVQRVYAQEFGILVGDHDEQDTSLKDRSWFAVTEALPGDVLMFRNGERERHVGLVLDRDLMLHSHRGANACIESWTSNLWKHRISSIYRHAQRCKKI